MIQNLDFSKICEYVLNLKTFKSLLLFIKLLGLEPPPDLYTYDDFANIRLYIEKVICLDNIPQAQT